MRNLEELNSVHSSRPAFIIGSGTSIAFQDLEPLKNHITIAVNSGYVGCPWATYFLSDDHSVVHWSYFFRDLRRSRHTTALLYEDKLAKTAEMFGERTVFFRHRTGYNITNRYSHEDREFRICQARTSIGSAIHVAHIMGCSPIILLGVDCYRLHYRPNVLFRYFWQVPKTGAVWMNNRPFRDDCDPIDRYRPCRYKGRYSDTDLVEILKYWKMVAKETEDKCEVYNVSPNSALKAFPIRDLCEVSNV